MDINGKIVIITGGAGGMGFEITKELLRNGAKVVLLYYLFNLLK